MKKINITGEIENEKMFVPFRNIISFSSFNYSQGKPEMKLNPEDPFDLQEVGAYIIKDKG